MRVSPLPFVALLTLVGCSDAPTDNPGTENPVERGPRAISREGAPNGTSWDAASETRYIADQLAGSNSWLALARATVSAP